MNNFFKHNDKVYSENLNDSVLVGNAFSWSISMDLPTDSDGLFPSSSDVVKAKVADVYATPNSNLSIGGTISNASGSSQVYRLTVYPNFNRFGGFTFVSLEGDGSVIITEKGGTSPVRNNLDYANLGNVTELKTLKEYDLVVTIPSGGVVTGLGFGFQSSTAGANAMISQANVSGLVDDLSSLESGKASLGHTHSTNDVVSIHNLPNIGASAGDNQKIINRAIDNKVGSLDTSIANIGTFEKVAENTTYELWVNTTTRCARILCHRTNITIGSGESFNNYEDFTIPSAYRPKKSVFSLIMRSNQFIFFLYDSGSYGIYNTGSSVSGYNINFQIDYTF